MDDHETNPRERQTTLDAQLDEQLMAANEPQIYELIQGGRHDQEIASSPGDVLRSRPSDVRKATSDPR